MSSTLNVSALLARCAEESPGRAAVVEHDLRATQYEEVERRVQGLTAGLRALGLARGDRVALFVRPGLELVLATHALFRVGAVPLLIDPGIGRAALFAALERSRPRGLIGVPRAHLARRLFPRAFASVELAVTVGPRFLGSGPTLTAVERAGHDASIAAPGPTAAILFTSGSTGPAKGVVVTHAMFAAQIAALRALYALEPGQVDAACFPLFALFDHALGMTSAFPPVDPTRPARTDPRALRSFIEESGATFSFGSPAIWRRVLPWMRARSLRFSGLRRVTLAGAPVPPALVLGLCELLPPGGEVHTPYGATEALPVCDASGALLAGEVAARTAAGEGTCIGCPVSGVELALIQIRDEPIERFDPALCVARGEPGEICVRGAVVSAAYSDDPAATRAAKMQDGATFWHRMGDVGWQDEHGRLWFLGRKSERLETERGMLMPVGIENLFVDVPGVERAALVGVGPRGRERAHLVIEPRPRTRRAELARGLRERAAAAPAAAPVAGLLFKRSFPVDVRHNAKIRRLELKAWAERELA
jgi:acyl-CoA synthetase (AMP-forming)/AMP-acid ligase II